MQPDLVSANVQKARQLEKLGAFSRVVTADTDEAMETIGQIFCPHKLDPLKHSFRDFYALHNSAGFKGLSINYVAYGGSVLIDPGCLEDFFLLQIPLRGSARIDTGGKRVEAVPGVRASLLSPTLPTKMIWQDNCAKLIFLIDRRHLEKRAAALAETAVRSVEFDPQIDLTSPFGRALQYQMEYLVDLAERQGPGRQLPPVAIASLSDAAISLLLLGQKHNLSDAIKKSELRDASAVPAIVKKARDHLEAHAADPLDLEELARACGVGIRSLQIRFKRHFGAPVSTILLDIRLDRLKQRLSNAGPGERVVDVAFELGFTHLSRMAEAYRAKFGESPSATLRRSR
jgi:AraC-like DNA-binding protein